MRVLTIAVHPDDETLGCSGTLLRHRTAGDSLYWLVVTQAHEPQWPAERIRQKAAEVQRVAEAYGMEGCFRLGFPTMRLDTVPQADLMGRIREVVAEVKPALVYVVHGGDVHSDHRAAFAATMSVLKPIHMARLGVRRVLCYEVLSSTEAAPVHAPWSFRPNVFVDITAYIDRKVEIMAMYQSEVQPDPLPRGEAAIRALARYRGTTIGVDYAEAFMLVRELI